MKNAPFVRRTILSNTLATLLASLLSTCAQDSQEPASQVGSAQAQTRISWLDYRVRFVREVDEGLIVEGDLLFDSITSVRKHYEASEGARGALAISTLPGAGGIDNRWSTTKQTNITYCIDTNFDAVTNLSTAQAAIGPAIRSAANDWESVANVRFVLSTMGNCDFRIRPRNSADGIFALASFPNEIARNLLVDRLSFTTTQPSLVGIMRHELGHILGFRHENVLLSGCAESSAGLAADGTVLGFRQVSEADANSAMYTPAISGCVNSNVNFVLTASDGAGARAVYGPPQGSLGTCGTVRFDAAIPCCATAPACESRRFLGDELFGCVSGSCGVSRSGLLVGRYKLLRNGGSLDTIVRTWDDLTGPDPQPNEFADLKATAPVWQAPSAPTLNEANSTRSAADIQIVNVARVLGL